MKNVFGGTIALIILAIYSYLIYKGIGIINCGADSQCQSSSAIEFNQGMTQALSVISGLISALVIAVMARAEPGNPVSEQLFRLNLTHDQISEIFVKVITWLYLVVWVGTGFWVFMKGLEFPKVFPAMTNLGQTWFGLAIASAYAYFGLRQPQTVNTKKKLPE
ncbi:hypothetical protein MNBD_GAMMA12-731 [hydrothermal vent metagenome]|uniref:Uncharacterized protein n=1 Tax=hydrothermal vent metagenome TaxID=652676 RepID=A0A3B0YL61_9ZZZZ